MTDPSEFHGMRSLLPEWPDVKEFEGELKELGWRNRKEYGLEEPCFWKRSFIIGYSTKPSNSFSIVCGGHHSSPELYVYQVTIIPVSHVDP